MDLSTLQSVLAPLAEVGKDERTFVVEGQNITVRPLLPHEEVAVQRFAVSSLEEIQKEEKAAAKSSNREEEDAMSRADALDYFDRFRIEVVAHSIVEINGTDLRSVDTITTGEVTSKGAEVRVPRHEAMRKIIRENWSRTMVTTAFTQYGELIESLAQKADELAELSETDLEVEIERVTERLAVLKKQRTQRAKGDSGIPKAQVDHFMGMGERHEETTQKLVEHHAAKPQNKKAPPTVVETPTPEPDPEPPTPEPEQVSFEDARSSFEDAEDPQVLAEEQRRILEARRVAQRKERDRLHQGSVPSKTAPVGGVETYRMPTEELSPRGKPKDPKGKAPELDPASRGELNPNFGRK